MTRWYRRMVFFALITATAVFTAIGTASAASISGTLSNFDVFNDTGQDCHGFEIELDGLSSKDITYTFADPYIRYKTPRLIDFAGGVYVRYESEYDPVAKVFKQATPIPPVISPTAGHQCWTGGAPGYLTAGCEHFGLGLTRNATATTYRWLIADPSKPGNLIASGTKVSIPAPVWNVAPPPPPGAPPVIQAAIPAEQPETVGQFGDAKWVKIFVTESSDRVDLHHLVTDDPAVPQGPGETEVEWVVLQFNPNPGANEGEIENDKPLGAGNQSVTRRYEFYKYVGGYDPDTHEALCSDQPSCPDAVGDYIGAQMGAALISPATQIPGVRVTTGGFGYSRMTRTYVGVVTVKNTSGQDIPGPVQLQLANLPAGVALVNPAGTFQGSPYLVIPGAAAAGTKLPVNQSVSFIVQFRATAPINFAANIFSGSFQ
jgi:hypothetical protein